MPNSAPQESPYVARVLYYDRAEMRRRGSLGGKRAAEQPERAAICAGARAAYQRHLEEQVDPDGVLSQEERTRRAGDLRRQIARDREAVRRAPRKEGGAA